MTLADQLSVNLLAQETALYIIDKSDREQSNEKLTMTNVNAMRINFISDLILAM